MIKNILNPFYYKIMFIKINLKKEFIYLFLFIPISLLKYIFEFYIGNSKNNYYLFIEPLSQIFMIFLYLYQKKSTKIFFNKLNYRIFVFKKHLQKQNMKKFIILCSIVFYIIKQDDSK